MTPKQRFHYLDLASRAHMELQSQLPIDEFRHQEAARASVAALLMPARFSHFTEDHFAASKEHFERIIDGKPFDAAEILRAVVADRERRLRWWIDTFTTRYGHQEFATILRERFGCLLIEELAYENRVALLVTLKERCRAREERGLSARGRAFNRMEARQQNG